MIAHHKPIIVTGAAGFIGSCMVSRLKKEGYQDIIAVDDFSNELKNKNLEAKAVKKIDRGEFFNWLKDLTQQPQAIFHLGARTDTTEQDTSLLNILNLDYTRRVWEYCTKHQIQLLYASSAATYGGGEHGYSDSHKLIRKYKPLNPYGWSKHNFDMWALDQDIRPPQWAGFKFFNVYGPNEYHKSRMASVIFHAFNQIQTTGSMKLFRSHNSQYKDGHQSRDFISVFDVVDVLLFSFEQKIASGIYNLGSGNARTFLDLTNAVFAALKLKPSILFIDTPLDIRDTYQYFTEADMSKLRSAGYVKSFTNLDDGVTDYVQQYLTNQKYY